MKKGFTSVKLAFERVNVRVWNYEDVKTWTLYCQVETLISNIMAKELMGPAIGSKEEQLQRKQQILEELQKVSGASDACCGPLRESKL